MGKIINDHINMVTRNGAGKAIPCVKITEWIANGIFELGLPKGNSVGYDFKEYEKGVADFEAWVKHQKELRAKRIARSRMPQAAPGGFADAQFEIPSGPVPADQFTTVPPVEPGGEEIDKGAEVKPKDVI